MTKENTNSNEKIKRSFYDYSNLFFAFIIALCTLLIWLEIKPKEIQSSAQKGFEMITPYLSYISIFIIAFVMAWLAQHFFMYQVRQNAKKALDKAKADIDTSMTVKFEKLLSENKNEITNQLNSLSDEIKEQLLVYKLLNKMTFNVRDRTDAKYYEDQKYNLTLQISKLIESLETEFNGDTNKAKRIANKYLL